MKTKSKLIYTSKDYSQFAKDVHNRTVRNNPKLRASMEKYGWLDAFPMLVVLRDGKMIIKDGQHRFDIATDMKLPVKYVVLEEDGLQASEISVGLSWSFTDHVNSYAQRGMPHYQKLLSFKSETGLPLRMCATLLYGITTNAPMTNIVKDGAFKVKNEAHARAVVSVINVAGRIVKWAQNEYFVSAVNQSISYAGADASVLCDRIRSNPGKLVLMPTIEDFLKMLEDIYNRRNHAPIAISHLVKQSIKSQRTENCKSNASKASRK